MQSKPQYVPMHPMSTMVHFSLGHFRHLITEFSNVSECHMHKLERCHIHNSFQNFKMYKKNAILDRC